MDRNRGENVLDIENRVREVISAESEALNQQLQVIDYVAIKEIVRIICECRGNTIITGCGTSGAAAKKIAHTLCCVDRPSMYMNPADAFHGGLGIVTADDVVIFLSKGGETPELVKLASICGKRGAITIAVSEKKCTPLTDLCTIWLKVKVEREPDKFNMLATASTISVISVMDAIAICVMEKMGYTKQDFAMIHPSGAVGDRLLGAEMERSN